MHKCYVPKSHVLAHIFKVGKKAKIRNLYNQKQHLTQETVLESDKNTKKHHTQEKTDKTI